MFHIREVEPLAWENFILGQTYTLFVQSSHYGDFYRMMGEKSWVYGIYDDTRLVGGSLILSTHAKRGNFLYVPYGPFLPQDRVEEAFRAWVEAVSKLGKEASYDFIRVSPFLEENETNQKLFQSFGFRGAPMHILAEITWLLDLQRNEEELLAGMNKNHRNLIRRCEREGVRIEKTTDQSALASFHELLDETTKRHHFHRFPRAYIDAEFAAFRAHNQALLFNAHLPNGELDASAIIIYYGTMAAYRHGASRNIDKRMPSSYLLQWSALQEAKKRGCHWYNFWGIAPEGSAQSHPFAGITHFKKGFGGLQMNLLRCQDLPLSYRYWQNWLIENGRRIWRGF